MVPAPGSFGATTAMLLPVNVELQTAPGVSLVVRASSGVYPTPTRRDGADVPRRPGPKGNVQSWPKACGRPSPRITTTDTEPDNVGSQEKRARPVEQADDSTRLQSVHPHHFPPLL
jgi:hypothetical protein